MLLLFLSLIITSLIPSVAPRNITIINRCSYTVWPGVTGDNIPNENTGFILLPNQNRTITVPDKWPSGRIWGRTNCYNRTNVSWGNQTRFVCDSGDCGSAANNFGVQCLSVGGQSPTTLAEFTLQNSGSDPNDYYDLSNVDGYNIPIAIRPVGNYHLVPGNVPKNCLNPQCVFNMSNCPDELKLQVNGSTFCVSLCGAVYSDVLKQKYSFLNNIFNNGFNRTLVCCQCWYGADPVNCSTSVCCNNNIDGCFNGTKDCCGCYNTSSVHCCTPLSKNTYAHGGICDVSEWPPVISGKYMGQGYDRVFKLECPEAYSWQFDDEDSTYHCNNADYEVVFCNNTDTSTTTTTGVTNTKNTGLNLIIGIWLGIILLI